MTRHMIAVAALAVAVMAPARPAAAQDGSHGGDGAGQGPFSVTGGWMWNVGDTPRQSQWIVGVQFANPKGQGGMGQWVLSADWIRIESESIPGVGLTRRKSSLIPVLLSHKYHLGGGPLYLMGGAGASWADKDIPEMGISDRFTFAWQAGVGYTFGTWFVEGRYLAGPHPSRDGMYGAQLGLSF